MMKSASAKLKRVFDGAKVDAILIANTGVADSSFLYLTGFTGGLFESTYLIAYPNKMVLIVNRLEYEIAKRSRPKEMKIVKFSTGKELLKYLKKYLRGKKIGINGQFLPYSEYNAIKKRTKPAKMIDVSENLNNARTVKGPDEVHNIVVANKIVKAAQMEILKDLKVGITEKEVATRFDYIMMLHGATGPSFSTIVCFGENAAIPHHAPDETKLKPNSFVLIDAGAKYNNYCSDVTRTTIFKPDKKSEKYKRMIEMYKTVKEAQTLAFRAIKPGVDGSKIHKIALDHINTARNGIYKGKFIHALGHSIGIDVHDEGAGLWPGTCILKENMVLSDEPGIYVVGFGGVRIEDDLLITKKGARFL